MKSGQNTNVRDLLARELDLRARDFLAATADLGNNPWCFRTVRQDEVQRPVLLAGSVPGDH
jgi:hypothetical protein